MPSFKIHTIEGYISSLYLLEYADRLLLLDSGCINDVKRIETFCRQQLKRSPADIKLALVSHMHPDHAGGAAALRNKHGIAIAAHKDADCWYAGAGGSLQHKLDCYMAWLVAQRNKRKPERLLFNPIVHPDFALTDLELLPGFDDWAVLHIPGHTLHDIALYNQAEGLLYIGDMICLVKGRFYLPLPVLFPGQMAVSYDKLSALESSTILMAHGGIEHPADASAFFAFMKAQLASPPTPFMKRIDRWSRFSPAVKQDGTGRRGEA